MRPKAKRYMSHPWHLRLLRSPVAYIVLGVVILGSDYFTGGVIQFPIAFIIPVVLASWFCSARIGSIFAVALPTVRLGFAFLWNGPISQTHVIVNLLIRLAVLLLIAYLAGKAARLTREVKLLQGILPVCSHCKKIRDQENNWHPIEGYISERSEADFSHGICPECAQLHYPEFLSGAHSA